MTTENAPRFFNRELSWLEFNQRVLNEAADETVPPLERLRFLCISASNLDEFFMVRVGGLKILTEEGVTKPDPSGMTPAEQLSAIGERTRQMVADQCRCFREMLEPKMEAAGIRRVAPPTLSGRQREAAERFFEAEILPVLTPMAVRADAPFPLLGNLSLSVCARLKPLEDKKEARYAVVPFGPGVPRMLTLPSDKGYEYIATEDLVKMFATRFFPGEEFVECIPFRITRNADFDIREDQAADLLEEMTEMLDQRKLSDCVRLELAENATVGLREFLAKVLGLREPLIYPLPDPLDLAAFKRLADLPGFDSLRFEPWAPLPSPQVDPKASIFETIAREDVLLIHPYESFEPVVRLIDAAADDPDVLAIKQTLYRTSANSPIVAALARAAQKRKSVAVVVELKARFDEARNIEWARDLEQAGVQVIYGVKGLKTHAKVCIIVRREPHGIQRYVHFGTGNYNETTARLYSDVSLMTSNDELASDASSLFNAITGYSQPQRLRKLEMTPIGLREKLFEMIAVEARHKRRDKKPQIIAKLNSLSDPGMIEALYSASQAGVRILLNIRGICCLKPGVAGLSEHIQVVSIVDRFLEHARILYFYHGGDERVFISSADWMSRNLDRRIELLVPVEEPRCRERLLQTLDAFFQDTVKARVLTQAGQYELQQKTRRPAFRAQEELCRRTAEAVRLAELSRPTAFEPHRAQDDQR